MHEKRKVPVRREFAINCDTFFLETAKSITGKNVVVSVNAADDIAIGSVFLTVNRTSAEGGDDGKTGRGNRANGLITPCRPMTLEASVGKNPLTHVGKLCSAAATRIAHAVVAEASGITEAECYLVSQIGAPVDRPRIVHLRVWCGDCALSTEADDRNPQRCHGARNCWHSLALEVFRDAWHDDWRHAAMHHPGEFLVDGASQHARRSDGWGNDVGDGRLRLADRTPGRAFDCRPHQVHFLRLTGHQCRGTQQSNLQTGSQRSALTLA
jgi:hypothetical protein